MLTTGVEAPALLGQRASTLLASSSGSLWSLVKRFSKHGNQDPSLQNWCGE